MELALGTVQFGLAYGITSRAAPVPASEVRALLRCAHSAGIRVLDTAAAYGDIEERLDALCCDHDFRIVSKLPALPDGIDAAMIDDWVRVHAERSQRRLGARLSALMFHRGDDLEGPHGAALWSALSHWCAGAGLKAGASCYTPELATRLASFDGFAITQLPGNALDQRVADAWPQSPGFEVHLRSAFLQGILLAPSDDALARVPAAREPLARWQQWCADRGEPRLRAALGIVKSFKAVSFCVVGVDGLAHLEQILDAWEAARPIHAPELRCMQPDVVDPRRWSALR
jgi:aryl-alcohol dehydrogenase-like predicted oxidoreductase